MSDAIIARDIVVPAECSGWRLDHFLKRRIGRMSRTKIQTIIGEQISFPDGRPARPSSPVRAGEIILLRRPAPVEPDVPRRFDILYEDDSVLVIDKPAGLPMHTTAKFWRNTLVALLRELYPDEQMEIAHRIDRETSGVLLIARNRPVASFLTRAFARRAVDKTYLALVKGQPPDTGRIDLPLRLLDTQHAHHDGRRGRRRARAAGGDQLQRASPPARARAVRGQADDRTPAPDPRPLRQPRPPDRRRQAVRRQRGAVHARLRRGVTDELLACFDGLPRHALHAHRLSFPHPVTKQTVTVESPLPADITAYIDALEAAD